MIYTLTVNPAIDYVIGLDGFAEGKINRTKSENIYAGGKGINVSTVLKNLGINSIALGFVAGPTGNMLESMIADKGLSSRFIHARNGMTRINVKMNAGIETEINGSGPLIGTDDIEKLYSELDELNRGDNLIMSGSIPGCIEGNLYSKICERLSGKGIILVVDATKSLLMETLKYSPFLVKPNNHELGEMFGVTIETFEDAIKYAGELRKLGAVNVMVSMASMGAVLVDEYGETHICQAPTGTVVNSVGAGDTTVAAFIAKCTEQKKDDKCRVDYNSVLKYAVAAGSATAFKSGLAGREDIERLM